MINNNIVYQLHSDWFAELVIDDQEKVVDDDCEQQQTCEILLAQSSPQHFVANMEWTLDFRVGTNWHFKLLIITIDINHELMVHL